MARVLVVDDEKLIVKGIRFSLEQDGYEVDCAYDQFFIINYQNSCHLTPPCYAVIDNISHQSL